MKRRVSTPKKGWGYFSNPLDDRYGASPQALRTTDIVADTQAKNYTEAL